jgi:hypothetical protein
MMEPALTGRDVLNPLWPEARWNLSGLYIHDRYIYNLCLLLQDRYGVMPKIDSVHGAPAVLWNSGRVPETDYTDEDIQVAIQMFNEIGIGVYFTFSNHLLTEADLTDEACNRLLGFIDNGLGLNGVILASELLHEYLRANYPGLKQTASIIKVAHAGRGNLDYYLDHAKRFDSVMVHPDDGFDLEILDKLDRDRMEIMVNENCLYMCQNRAQHYDLMPKLQKLWLEGEITKEETRQCHNVGGGFQARHRSCNFRTEELQAVYAMGFRRFKLQGRADVTNAFAFDTMRFMLERDIVMPLMYKAFMSGWGDRHGAPLVKARMQARTNPNTGSQAGQAE